MSLWSFDQTYLKDGMHLIGVDEAGRGPLAGPVVAAAVILDYTQRIEGLDDSKKLSANKREKLYTEIIATAKAYRIVQVPVSYIDEHNILQASLYAMREAIIALNLDDAICLIDGNHCPKQLLLECIPLIKGDGRSACVAAASILAKVYRDRLMQELEMQYPGYGFAKHKGYGTPQHLQALDKYGVCPEHRTSFEPIRQRTIWNINP